MKDHFSLTSGVLPAETRVASFKGVEALSTPYQFEVNLLVPNEAEIELEDVLGDSVTLTLQPESGHVVSGVIATFELLAEASTYGLFRATIVPKLWYLTLTHHSRVFVGESVKDIIEKILKANDLSSSDYTFKLSGKYLPFDHVCQYQESDFNFISRLMEREGLYYFFEHSDSGEVLVITDASSFHTAKSETSVRYVAQMGADVSAGASLDTYVCKRTTLPTKIALKDYDYLKPKLDVSGGAPVSSAGKGEVHVYGGNFTTPDDGKRLAKLRAEEMLGRQTIYTGEGRVYDLSAGYTFTLDEHPRTAFNMEYLAIAVYHYGNQSSTASAFQKLLDIEHDEPYHVRVEAIPAKLQYRAPRVTPIPRIYGTEEAVIDAEDGNVYAEIDPNGRYKVKIFFDETDLEDGKASMWVRMLQPHGGDIEGFHFPLRKGTEVHLVFLGGDPDRPVIAGVAHNAHNPSAVTQKNNTRNIMQTGGKNKIEMEDTDGAQFMHLKTEPKGTFFFMGAIGKSDGGKLDPSPVYVDGAHGTHNLHLDTDGTGLVHTTDDLTIDVTTGNMLTTIDGGTMTTDVKVGTSLHHVKGTVTENFDDTVTQNYGKLHTINVITGGRLETITGDYNHTLTGTYNQTISKLWNLGAKNVVWTVDEDITITATNNIEITGNDVSITCKGMHNESTVGLANEFFFANQSELYIGGKEELKLGSFTDITIGNKNEITLANVNEISLSNGFEYKASPLITKEELKMKLLEITVEELDSDMKKAKTTFNDVGTSLAKANILVYNSPSTLWM